MPSRFLTISRLNRAAVIASSAGGPIGMRLALDHPDRVSALVLLNTGAALMSSESNGSQSRRPVRCRSARDGSPAHRAVGSSWNPKGSRRRFSNPKGSGALRRSRRARIQSWLRFERIVCGPWVGLSQSELVRLGRGALLNMQAQRDVDLTDRLHEINCPTLIVHGDADTTVPIAFGEALAGRISEAELAILHAACHGLIAHAQAQSMLAKWLLGV